MLILGASVNGQRLDVRCSEVIAEVGTLAPLPGEAVVDLAGAALLPGLHDHHIHLRAMAARRNSLDCSGLTREELLSALSGVSSDGWLRGFGYHADASGELDRETLDAVLPDQPVRIQHSSGKMWVLNSNAVELLGLSGASHPGVETKGDVPTGRIFRMDDWLDERLPRQNLDLTPVLFDLLKCGITSATDTSFNNDAHAEATLSQLSVSGQQFPVRVMGDESLQLGGQLKILLDEDALPSMERLGERVATAHERDRGVAFHCVSRVELLVCLDILGRTGVHPEDRIEHGAIIAEDILPALLALDVPVVTQPGFLRVRGERFRRELDDDVADLYRYQSLLDAGIRVICSSDAPYGPYDPWYCIQAAVDRVDDAGVLMSPSERVPTDAALSGYLLTDDLRATRSIEVGMPANLVARDSLENIVSVWLGGQSINLG